VSVIIICSGSHLLRLTQEMDAASRTLEVEHHKLTAKLEAAERAAERAGLNKSRLQNDVAIQRTQLEAVAALCCTS
jgi:hypothetical protein